jgi:hypothetical protein
VNKTHKVEDHGITLEGAFQPDPVIRRENMVVLDPVYYLVEHLITTFFLNVYDYIVGDHVHLQKWRDDVSGLNANIWPWSSAATSIKFRYDISFIILFVIKT